MMRRLKMFIPSDVCYEILARLPVRALAKFRAACNPWRKMISEEAPFKNYHISLSEEKPRLLVVRNIKDDADHSTLDISSYDTVGGEFVSKIWNSPFIPMRPIQSCRGLVCLGGIYSGTENQIAICHPSLGSVVFLPRIRGLADDVRIQTIGFGYSFRADEFKVVIFCCRYDYSEETPEFLVLTLGTDTWRTGGKPPFEPSGRVPYLHGALHLMPLDGDDGGPGPGIGVLDLGSEACTRTIPFPERFINQYPTNVYGARKLVALKGSLYLAFCTGDGRDEVWCLTDYERGLWSKSSLKYLCTTPFPTPVGVMADGSVTLQTTGTSDEQIRYYPTEAEDIMEKDRYHALYAESLSPIGN